MRRFYLIPVLFFLMMAAVKAAAPIDGYFPTCTLSVTATTSGSTGHTICLGSSVGLVATPSGGTSPYTYAWSPSMGLSNAAIANPVATPTVSTTYTIHVIDHSGCSASASIAITVNQPPTINADTLLLQYLTHQQLTARGGVSPYTYTFSPAISTSSLVALLTSTVTTIYTITVTGANGCSNTYSAHYVPLPTESAGACATLFFSEYIQDTIHNNDAIEIYNPTAGSINLSSYYLQGTTNGSLYATPFFMKLHGTVAAHSTFLIAYTHADTALTHKANMLSDSLTFWGKDIVALSKMVVSSPNLQVSFLDMVGAISPLPTDSGWAVSTGSTKNHTLVRQSSVNQGDLNWSTCKTEWNVYSRGTFSYIGHYNNVCTPEDAILYFSLANDSVSCGDPSYYYFDVMISADSAKILVDADVTLNYPESNIAVGFPIVTMGPDFMADSSGADYVMATVPAANSLTIQMTAQNPAYQQEVVDSIPKIYAHVKFKMANGCQSGDITFDHTIYSCHYVDEDSTLVGIDSTITDSLSNQHECAYQCNPYACNPHCCDISDTDEYGNCIDTCWDSCYQTCYETCYDTTQLVHRYNVYLYSRYTDKLYSDVMYTNSIPLLTCPPIISETLAPINAGTNAASDPANSSILTIKGANFGTEEGQIDVPNANAGGVGFVQLDSIDILSWTNSKIVLKMPSVLASNNMVTPGSGGIELFNACDGYVPANLTINYSVIGTEASGEKLRDNIAMSTGANSLVFRCDTSISNHSLIYAVVQQAIATWDCYTGVNWKMGNDTILESDAQDGVSNIYFSTASLGAPLMETTPHVDNGCSEMSDSMAYVHEADIAINRIPIAGYTWNYNVSDTVFPGNYYYFYDVLLHELGHAHLLNHVDDPTSLMYYSFTPHQRKNILSGDYPGPQTLYGGFDVVNTSAVNTPSCSYGILIPSSRTCIDHTLDVPSEAQNVYNLTLYPNPVSNTNITISYELTQDSYIQFKIIDYSGREVMALSDEHKLPGTYREQINTDAFARGLYLLIANINGNIQTIKFIKL